MNGSSTCPSFNSSEPMLTRSEQALAISFYTIIAAVGICSNGMVCFTVLRFQRMRTSPNFLIANLALSNILMAALCIPFSYWPILILQFWPFGHIMCPIIHFCQMVAVMLNAHTIILISIDRFCAIMFPLKYYCSQRQAVKIILGLWIFDMTVSLPVACVQRAVPKPDTNGSLFDCIETWSPKMAFSYSQVCMVLQYFIPLLIILISYSAIGLSLWHSPPPGDCAEQHNKMRKDSMKKLLLMSFLVSFMYTLCWLPLNVLTILWTKCESYLTHPYILQLWWACHAVAMSHSCINPLIYLMTSSRFREGYKYILHQCFPTCISFKASELYRTPTMASSLQRTMARASIPTQGHLHDGTPVLKKSRRWYRSVQFSSTQYDSEDG